MATGASWPWNLSTVPTRASGAGRASRCDRARPGRCRARRPGCRPSRRARRSPSSVHPGRAAARRSIAPSRDDLGLLRRVVVGRRRGRPDEPRPHAPTSGAVAARARCTSRSRLRLEAALVEHLRREPADDPDAAARSSRGTARGRAASSPAPSRSAPAPSVRARRVGALDRLVELLRVAEQDEAVGRAGDREDVGERHLAGLVHEQDVDRVAQLGVRPEPRRPAGEIARPSSSRRGRRRCRRRPRPRGSSRTCVLRRPSGRPDVDAPALARPP